MDSSLDLIRAKISELEEKLANLRIAEREIVKLDKPQAPKAKALPKETIVSEVTASAEPAGQQTMVSAITSTLDKHGPLSAAHIAEQIAATGKEVNNRAVSFSLQALKKRGLVKNTDGVWTLGKGRSKRSRA